MIISGGSNFDFAPQALGETTPISSATGYFYPNTGLDLSGKFATYGALYVAQPSIATVVNKVANAVARLTLNVWDTTPATGKVIDTSSEFAKLLARPNSIMSPYAFYRWTAATRETYGEAFWLKVRDSSGKVVQLLPMHPSRTAVKRDEDGNVFYVFTIGVASAGLLTAPAEDVVPFLAYNPDDLMRGLSPLEPLRTTLLNEDAARRATSSWWKRGARPSFMLSTDNKLSEPAINRLRGQVNSQHAGADNMGGTMVLEEGLKPVVTQLSAEEMQYIETRKLNVQEVCMVYDIPPPVVHILDHATFSNITEQMRSMYRDSMAPRLEDYESVIDFFLRPEFGEDRVAKFALDEVLRGDFETRATSVSTLIERGVMKPSEARVLFDLPDAGDTADKLYANAALQELGMPAERISITAAASASDEEDQQVSDMEEAVGAEPAPSTPPPPAGQPAPSAPPVRRGGRPPKKEKA